MKKLFLLLFLLCAVVASPFNSTAKVAMLQKDSPPVRTYYHGYFVWGGDMYLPAGNYQVLADPSDTSKVLYLYDALADVTYECVYSSYDAVNGTATINLNLPTYGMVYFGTVSVPYF